MSEATTERFVPGKLYEVCFDLGVARRGDILMYLKLECTRSAMMWKLQESFLNKEGKRILIVQAIAGATLKKVKLC